MKLSKVLHVISVMVGGVGVIMFLVTIFSSSDGVVFGSTKVDSLLCSSILILIAIWLQIATMHHMMLEKSGEKV